MNTNVQHSSSSLITMVAALVVCVAVGTATPLAAETVIHAGQNQPEPRDIPYPGVITIHVDATDVDRRIFVVNQTIPVKPGPLYLLYPAWIPGIHSSSGPINKVAGLVIRANGKVLPWKRDQYNVYAFHVDVPEGAERLDVDFKFLSSQKFSQGGIRMTPEMLSLTWSKVSLYPAGYYTRQIKTVPSVTLPSGWQFGSALRVEKKDGNTHTFKPVSYEHLVDSPIYAGKYFKRLDLTSKRSPPVHINFVADEPANLAIEPAQIKALRNIVIQMEKLYGTFPFDHYDFLFSLSDNLAPNGIEHHQSSENGSTADYFTKWNADTQHDLLPHEFNHSWNGKYRRPADLSTPNFNVPMGDSLLWVYEGQTEFWGKVLAARTGLESKEAAFQSLASIAATYDTNRPGLLTWRNIQDTTNDPTISRRTPSPYVSYQGREDYYFAGMMIWLSVDGKMRALSKNKHTLDEFARDFFRKEGDSWDVRTYTFDDVVATLEKIVPYDWRAFLRARLDGHRTITEGLAAQGWKVVYTDTPSKISDAMLWNFDGIDLTHSLGFSALLSGSLRDVRWDSPAFNAGLSPGATIVAVGGKEFSVENMKQAVTAAKGTDKPIELLVKNFDKYKTLHISYNGGLKYPHLERIEGTPDYLSQLYAPK